MTRFAVPVGVCLCLAAAASQAAERLQVPQLAGWKVIASISDRTGQSAELIPENESKETWTRNVAVQAFRGNPMTVEQFLEKTVEQTAAVCDDASAGPPSYGQVSGGAPAGSRAVACGRYKGDGYGSYILYFVVRGREALYVTSRRWRGAPFAQGQMPVPAAELQDWIKFADQIDLCDTADPARPCRD